MNPATYAEALFRSTKDPVVVLPELRALADAIRRTPGLQPVLVDAGAKPAQDRDRIIAEALKGVPELLRRLVATLVSERQLDRLDEITRAYAALLRRAKDLVEVVVEAPKHLTEAELETIVKSLGIKGTPLITQRPDPALIGGLRVVVDDVEHDLSIAGALNKLKYQLTT